MPQTPVALRPSMARFDSALALAITLVVHSCTARLAAQAAAPALPALHDVRPHDLLPDERTLVNVFGEGFLPETRVFIEDAGELEDRHVLPDVGFTIISGHAPVLPAGALPGWKSVTVADARGSVTLPNAVLYVGFDDPYLKSCWPWEVGPEGGVAVHFLGRNFRAGLVPVLHDPNDDSIIYPCTDPELVNPGDLKAILPPLPARAPGDFYHAYITDGPGGPIVTRRGSLLAVAEGTSPPRLLGVEPIELDARGGTIVSIRGENLRADASTYVHIPGAGFLSDLQHVSSELVTGIQSGIAPLAFARRSGPYDVVIVDARGESRLAGAVSYVDKIRRVTPSQVSSLGGDVVVFEGFGFHPSFVPQLGDVPLVAVQHDGPERLTGQSPPLPPGRHAATLLSADGTEVLGFLPDAVEVLPAPAPAIDGVVPETVSTIGGTEVTFTGTNFAPGLVPRLGGQPLLGHVHEGAGRLRGFSPELLPGLHDAELVGDDGHVVALLAQAVEAVPPSAVPLIPGPCQAEGSLAKDVARFAWFNPVIYDTVLVKGLNGSTIRELPGAAAAIEVPARGAREVTVVLQGTAGGRESEPCQVTARLFDCDSPPPLTGRDLAGNLGLTLYGGSAPAKLTRCDAGGNGGGQGGEARGSGAGHFVSPATTIGIVHTAMDRRYAGDALTDPPGSSNTNKLVTGFTLAFDAEKIEIAAFYRQLESAAGLSLRGKLIHVFPDDGFRDELTFPDVLVDKPAAWSSVTYFRAQEDPGAASVPQPCPGGPRIPAGEYLLEIYAVGGDPNLPYFEIEDDGRASELLIPGAPCPPYPRVRVTDVSGLRTVTITGATAQVLHLAPGVTLPNGVSIPALDVTHYTALGYLDDGHGNQIPFDKAGTLGLEFSWTLHYQAPPVSRFAGGVSALVESGARHGCYQVDVSVLDKTCGLSRQRSFEVRILPPVANCAGGGFSFHVPRPDPGTISAITGLAPAPGVGTFHGKRPAEIRVLVSPCCGGDPFACPAPRLEDLEVRLAAHSPLAIGLAPIEAEIEIEDLCRNQDFGPKYFMIRIADLGAIPGIAAGGVGGEDERVVNGFVPKEVFLQGRKRAAGAFESIGGPMRLYNRPRVLERSHWSGYYVDADQSYRFLAKLSPSAAVKIDMPASSSIRLPIEGVNDARISSFGNGLSLGLTAGFTLQNGQWRAEEVTAITSGEVLGNRLDGAPLRLPAASGSGATLPIVVPGGPPAPPTFNWCGTCEVLNHQFSQTLFESMLYTGSIRNTPVSIFASIQLALEVILEAQARVQISPFKALPGGHYFSGDVYLTAKKLDLRVPCKVRSDVIFGLYSVAVRLVPTARGEFAAHAGAVDLNPDFGARLKAFLSLYFEAEFCILSFLIDACVSTGEIKVLPEVPLVDVTRGNSSFAAEPCAAPAPCPIPAPRPFGAAGPKAGGGGQAIVLNKYQETSAPVTVTAPDGVTTLDSWIDESGQGTLFVNVLPTEIPTADRRVGSFLDPAAAFLNNKVALVAWTRSYGFDTGIPPNKPDLTLAEENLLNAQTEIVISTVHHGGPGFQPFATAAIPIADVPAEVPELSDRRADGRAAIAADLPREQAVVAWVRCEAADFLVADPTPTRVYEPGTVDGEYGLEAVDRPTIRPQLDRMAIYARRVGPAGALGPAVKLSRGGINIEPAIAFSPSGETAYVAWVNDSEHRNLTDSNLGRNLLYSVYRRQSDSWSEPAPVLASPDDHPALLEPSIALSGDREGLLAFTAIEAGSPERDSGLAAGSRFVHVVRLADGRFGAPERVHGKCQRRIYGHWTQVRLVPPNVKTVPIPGLPGLPDGLVFPPEFMVFHHEVGEGAASKGNVMATPVIRGAALAPVNLTRDDDIHSNVAATVVAGGVRAVSLNGGPSLPGLGAGGGIAGPRGFQIHAQDYGPDLAIASCTLSEQFPAPGTLVRASVMVENLGLGSTVETVGGEVVAGVRAVFIDAGGDREVAGEQPLPRLLPGESTLVELDLEQPHEPVRLLIEIAPNPLDAGGGNDTHECFLGAPAPADFACESVTLEVHQGESVHKTAAARLSWTLPALVDEVCLYRDGQVFASIPGGSASFVDRDVSPGVHVYEARARTGASRSARVALECEVKVESPPGAETFRRGDADASGGLNITDAVVVLGYLFLGNRAPACFDGADADDSGDLQITDAVRVLGFLFLGGAAPPAPGPDACGEDSTADELETCGEACP